MNTERIENKLKQLSSELRAHDSERMPSFNAAISASAPASSTLWRLSAWMRFAAGTAGFVLLIGSIAVATVQLRTSSFEKEARQWTALSEWEASSDSLLSISGTPWGSSIMGPSDSLLNAVADLPGTKRESL